MMKQRRLIHKILPRQIERRIETRRIRKSFKAKLEDSSLNIKGPRIIYGLTPPPSLKNIGDHAQVVAIRRWMEKHFPNMPVLEVDKNEVLSCLDLLRDFTRTTDLVFIHSGGNLGDRGMWSERGRRSLIANFHENLVISLPQTIFFSNTAKGQREKEASIDIYGRHPNLMVVARDRESERIAIEMFPRATVSACPDFVLSIELSDFNIRSRNSAIEKKALVCLRNDSESALAATEREKLISKIPFETTVIDTNVNDEIEPEDREKLLVKTLMLFNDHDVVITDRFHGLIFSHICKKPTLIIPTVDHKITSGVEWFEHTPWIREVGAQELTSDLLESFSMPQPIKNVDFNSQYFIPLASDILHQVQG